MQNFYFLVVVFCFLFLAFGFCQAAILYLEPSSGEYHQDDTFIVEARIDTEGECINAVEANFSFSQVLLKAADFSQGNSILTFWVAEPVINQEAGLVSFAGGIPAGYCGRLPGDPGQSNLLGRIIFQVKEIGGEQFSAKLEFLDTCQVLLNDGLGTSAELSFQPAVFSILPGKTEIPKKEWQVELERDEISPESFEIELSRDPKIFEGKYFITFHTGDKQSGLDYYEVKEGESPWQKASSPYLLKNQKLGNRILVKAVDKAGNGRIAQYIPTEKAKPFPWWILILILVGIGLIWWIIIAKLKRKKTLNRIETL